MEQYGYAYGYFIHSLDGNYILVTSDGMYTLYEVSYGISLVGTIETDKTIKEIKDGEIVFGVESYSGTTTDWSSLEVHRYSDHEFL